MHDRQSFMVDFCLTVSTPSAGASSFGSSGPDICSVRPYEPRKWGESWVVRVKTSGGAAIARLHLVDMSSGLLASEDAPQQPIG